MAQNPGTLVFTSQQLVVMDVHPLKYGNSMHNPHLVDLHPPGFSNQKIWLL